MVLSILLVVAGCATTSEGSGGNVWLGRGAVPTQDESEMLRAAEAEVVRVVEQIGATVRDIDSVGAHLTLTFWLERGALTWTGYEARERVGHRGGPVGAADIRDALREVLAGYGLERTGQVVLSLRREERQWSVDYSFHRQAERPPEARTLPVQWADDTGPDEVPSGLARLLAGIGVPNGGEAWLEADAVLEDGRVVGWELHHFQVTRSGAGGSPQAPASRVGREVVRLTRSFQDGIGPRTVRFGIRLTHSRGEGDGWVESARVVGFAPPTGLEPEVAAEYRAMHEDIVRRWREGVAEGFTWLAQRGVQELALWYVGAVAIKGAGFLAVRGGGIVRKALRQGKEAASGWLRTMLSRVPQSEGRAFERLWTKVQLEGERALTTSERGELRALMARIEKLASMPLELGEKHGLRKAARISYKRARPDLAPAMDAFSDRYPVHHRRPLEYAHLFPEEDINASSRLAVVQDFIHERVSRLWTKFRTAQRTATRDEVEAATRIIDSHFESWYHRVEVPRGEQVFIERAEQAALEALKSRFPKVN
ncbi:hypothetical protein HUW62_13240 [Myxococcus sp. AM011]|uniref:hypothetical protein n=1 Tax=Myxococcus sp. AM011 TaxID=2745200 RepID=UPI0015951E9A|nr:hypothetical protein [Myxococcus sp. AM011]NVJ22182.1 hypothetical protein [Myxococcus sp. AM011]